MTASNDAESDGESRHDGAVGVLDSTNSDNRDIKAERKASKPLPNSLEPGQMQEPPKPLAPFITMNLDVGEGVERIGEKKYSILKKIRLAVASTTHPLAGHVATGRVKIKFKLLWNPKDFMRRQFGDSILPSIGSVIVLNGTSLKAQATTCKEYLRKHWPTTYLTLLKCLDSFIITTWGITRGKSPILV
jgi:hypothetical protein